MYEKHKQQNSTIDGFLSNVEVLQCFSTFSIHFLCNIENQYDFSIGQFLSNIGADFQYSKYEFT